MESVEIIKAIAFLVGILLVIYLVAPETAFLLLIVYFAPTLQAKDNNKEPIWLITILNLLLGWTIVGWAVMYWWAKRDNIN